MRDRSYPTAIGTTATELGPRLSRRALVSSFTAVAATMTLAACGPLRAGSQDISAKPQAASLEIWSPTMNAEQTAVQEQVQREFERKYPHLLTKLTIIPGGWDPVVEKLQLSVTSGTQPNTTRLPDNPIRLLIFQKQLTALNAFINKERFDIKVLDKGMVDRTTVDGKHYTLPWSGGMLALYYNQDLFEKAGVTLPVTTQAMNWERFVDAAVKVHRLGDDIWGYQQGGDLDKPNWSTVKDWLPFLWSNGNDYFDNTETRPLFGDAKGIASVQLISDLMRKYRVTPGPGQSRPGGPSGRVGMWVSQSGDIVNMRERAPNVRFGCSLIPIGPDGKISYGVQGGSFIAIPQGAKHQDETWLYLRWVTDGHINLRLVTPAFQDPVHATNRVKPPFSDIPAYKAFVEQYKTARARPGNPTYRLTEESTAAELQAAYRGDKSPPDAVKAAVEKAIAIIQQHTRR